MEEVLFRGEACDLRIGCESSRFGSEVVFTEVGESAFVEGGGDSLSNNILLAHTGTDLTDIQIRSFRSGQDHHFNVVVVL